jgi:hypothetical protein
MTVLVTVRKDRSNIDIPFKDSSQGINYETWPGFIESIPYPEAEGLLSRTINYRFDNREYFENPILTEEQKAIKLQGENYCNNNNIRVTITVLEE